MKLDFLTPDDPRWAAFLDRAEHQLYHLPGYADLWARREGGEAEAVLITAGDDYFFAPYIVSKLEHACGLAGEAEGLSDLRSPYGYPGPLVRAQAPQFLTRAVRKWCTAMRDRGVISGFLRFDPLAPEQSQELSQFGRLCLRGDTVSIDLTADEATIQRQLRGTFRKQVAAAELAGLSVSARFGADAEIDSFHRIYRDTMHRVAANRDYCYSREHLQDIARLLGDGCGIGLTQTADGTALSGGMFLEYRGVVQHHLQGTRIEGLRRNATKLLVCAMIRLLKARGNRVLHLGGGRGGAADGLLQFKRGFSRERHSFFTWHLTFLPQQLRRLVTARKAPVVPAVTEFFPAYRRLGDLTP